MALWPITKPLNQQTSYRYIKIALSKNTLVISPKTQASLKSRKTVCALQNLRMGRVGMRLDHAGIPSVPPSHPCLYPGWTGVLDVRVTLVSHCNGLSISRRNSSVGEKQNGLSKRSEGALKPEICSVCALWCDSQAGGERHEKCPLRNQKEHMAPRCFDPVFKDTP